MLQFHEIAADVRAKVFFFIRSVPIQESMSYTQTQCRTQRLGFFSHPTAACREERKNLMCLEMAGRKSLKMLSFSFSI